LNKPAWLGHNSQLQKTMKVGHCGVTSSQVLHLSDKQLCLDGAKNYENQKVTL